jgi:hypothetical protein
MKMSTVYRNTASLIHVQNTLLKNAFFNCLSSGVLAYKKRQKEIEER